MTQITPGQSPPPIPEQKDECDKEHAKSRRSTALLAALGLVAITGGAVAGLVYDAIINGGAPSIAQLSTIATLGVGGLLALAGVKEKN